MKWQEIYAILSIVFVLWVAWREATVKPTEEIEQFDLSSFEIFVYRE